MNGVRTIFRRKGYLLTALAAAVLLAASSGTAYAQSIGFDKISGSVMEKAFVGPATGSNSSKHPPLEIKVRVKGLPPVGDNGRMAAAADLAPLVVVVGPAVPPAAVEREAPALVIYRVRPKANGVPQGSEPIVEGAIEAILFDTTDEVTLLVAPGAGAATTDGDWVDNDVVITLSAGSGILSSPNQVVVTVIDQEVAPVVKFDRTGVLLSEDSETSVNLDVKSGSPSPVLPAGLAGAAEGDTFRALRLSISSPAAVSVTSDTVLGCVTDRDDSAYGRKALYISAMKSDDDGVVGADAPQAMSFDAVAGTITFDGVSVADLATAAGGGIRLELTACGDNNFRDMDIALAFVESRLQSKSPGNVVAGAPAMISIRSNDASPTVEFFPTDVFIDEGGEHDVLLSATGENSADVMMATLRVEHDETNVGLYYKDGDKIEPNADGTLTVEIEDGQVRLTAKSYSDPDLMDGDMAKKTWIIMSADGAEVGDGYWYTVNVSGSTAVPALPLVGQLLLALFLMAGGARLYRRRQG